MVGTLRGTPANLERRMSHTIAYHEAGHVVMAWLHGLSYDCVSLEGIRDGGCHDAGLKGLSSNGDETGTLTRVSVILGGPLAEARFDENAPTLKDDFAYAADLLRCVGLLDVDPAAADTLEQLTKYWEQVETVAAELTREGTLTWEDVVDTLGVPGRSLTVGEQRVRARRRILHRICERLDAELRQLECDGLPPRECRARTEALNKRIRSTWSQFVDGGQQAIRLRGAAARKHGDRALSVYCTPRAQCRAEYRITDIHDLRVDHFCDGEHEPSTERYLIGYVDCDLMVGGYLCHSCPVGPPPHLLQVIVSERENEPDVYDEIFARAEEKGTASRRYGPEVVEH